MGDTAKAGEFCRTEMLQRERMELLIDENQQLCRIINASAKTVQVETKKINDK